MTIVRLWNSGKIVGHYTSALYWFGELIRARHEIARLQRRCSLLKRTLERKNHASL